MQNDWIETQDARNIVGQFDERRPAWLWSSDGQTLIWQNHAARLFLAKQKKDRIKLAKEAVPIKGQVRRLLRLGSVGLSSLARVRFMAGNKPVSATCSCLPVILDKDQVGLLIVAVDPVDATIFENSNLPDTNTDGGGQSEAEKEEQSPQSAGDDAAETGDEKLGQLSNLLDKLVNNSDLFEPLSAKDEIIPDELKQAGRDDGKAGAGSFEPEKQDPENTIIAGGDTATRQAGVSENKENPSHTSPQSGEQKALWQVRGAGFAPLERFQDKWPRLSVSKTRPNKDLEPGFESSKTEKAPDPQKDLAGDAPRNEKHQSAVHNDKDNSTREELEAQTGNDEEAKKADRVAHYNFDELSRILKKRIGNESQNSNSQQSTPLSSRANGFAGGGRTLNLSEEMLVLNRLPIGILIFKDQKILFANRAFASLMGSSSISRLHEGGLDGLFPRVENADAPLGPVVSLIKLDGKEVLVDARLQTITWQGGPALMLSASEQNSAPDGEASVKAFTRSLARIRGQGYFEVNDAGIITFISQQGAKLLGQSVTHLNASALSLVVESNNIAEFHEFLQQKARFAGEMRPHIRLDGARKNLEIEIFTEGQAGIVTGYFGIICPKDIQAQSQKDDGGNSNDSPLLARLSRGIRRPLNTILGFSELIYSEAFGAVGHPRYSEYARDIKSAGTEIAQLVDEMDEYSRLKDTNFVPDSADFDLFELLDECLRLVRSAANKRQVFVRSAIAQALPAICADRASMRQAILNLLASAIEQTPAGGKVILSAQIDDDGSVGIHVRDSAKNPNTTNERFAVFREGNSRTGEALIPMKSSMGLALTRSLLAVNACALHVDPSVGVGTLMSLTIPAEVFGAQN